MPQRGSFSPETLWAHHRRAHQYSLAPRAGANHIKVATLTYRALHVSAPPYLASSFTYVADMPHRRRLRSASTEQLDVRTCRRSTIGGRAFHVAVAKVWNGLPSDVTSASSLSVFKTVWGWRHTCSAAATKLFDFEWHFLFLVIISPPEQWPLQ